MCRNNCISVKYFKNLSIETENIILNLSRKKGKRRSLLLVFTFLSLPLAVVSLMRDIRVWTQLRSSAMNVRKKSSVRRDGRPLTGGQAAGCPPRASHVAVSTSHNTDENKNRIIYLFINHFTAGVGGDNCMARMQRHATPRRLESSLRKCYLCCRN